MVTDDADRPADGAVHPDPDAGLPVDPDIDLRLPAQAVELPAHPGLVLGAIAAGGVLGSLARYGVALVMTAPRGAFPWSTFAVNVLGSLLIGVLIVAVTRVWTGQRYLRPFLGVGVLGGFTTFSTSIVDTQHLAVRVALLYAGATLAAALLATYVGIVVTERLVDR